MWEFQSEQSVQTEVDSSVSWLNLFQEFDYFLLSMIGDWKYNEVA